MMNDHRGDDRIAISESEVARRADVSVAALRKWRRLGVGPRFLRLGRLVRYLDSDLRQWLESRAVEGGQKILSREKPI